MSDYPPRPSACDLCAKCCAVRSHGYAMRAVMGKNQRLEREVAQLTAERDGLRQALAKYETRQGSEENPVT